MYIPFTGRRALTGIALGALSVLGCESSGLNLQHGVDGRSLQDTDDGGDTGSDATGDVPLTDAVLPVPDTLADSEDDSGDATADVPSEPDVVDAADVEPDNELDSIVADTDTLPPLLSNGEPCTTNDQCRSELCQDLTQLSDELRCLLPCSTAEECATDEVCHLLSDSDGACLPPAFCIDADLDGFGIGPGCVDVDCDDDRPGFHRDDIEVCDGVDNNCNGEVDEDAADIGTACLTGGLGACEPGVTWCNDGTLACAATGAPTSEICDDIDNDCDGEIDEESTDAPFWYRDTDEDLFGNAEDMIRACEQPDGYVGTVGDCADSDPLLNPDAAEACDGIDNDCDDLVDEDFAATNTASCDGDSVNGCETDLLSSPLHCGECGAACETDVPCFEGNCGCPEGLISCGGTCTTPNPCGGCDALAAPGSGCGYCDTGAVECTSAETTVCVGATNALTDSNNCGGCGLICDESQTCENGRCTCPPESIVFAAQPHVQADCLGATPRIAVEVLGDGMSYQWQADSGGGWFDLSESENFGGTTTPELTVFAPTAGLRSLEFRVLVTGPCSERASDIVSLTLLPAPAIISAEVDQIEACAGDSLSLTSIVQNATAVAWVDDSGLSYPGNGLITTPDEPGERTFTLQASNECGAVETSRTVLVRPQVEIIEPPEPFYLCEPGLFRFTAAANIDTVEWAWQRNLNAGAGWEDLVDGPAVIGSDTDTLVVDRRQVSSATTYRVRVSNLCNAVTADARLIEGPPRIISAGAAQTRLCAGDTLQLQARVADAQSFGWTGPDGFSSMEQNPSLPDVTAASQGIYTFRATNVCGSATRNTSNISVSPAVTIVDQPKDAQTPEGQLVAFWSVASEPGADLQWQSEIDGVWTDLINDDDVTGVRTTELRVRATTANDGRRYRMVASACGTVNSDPATLIINNDAPIADPVISVDAPCQNATIQLTAPEYDGATYRWTGPRGFSSTSRVVEIANLRSTSVGTYTVVVSSPEGSSIGTVDVPPLLPPLMFTQHPTPSSRSTCGITDATFTVAVSMPDAVLQWQRSPPNANTYVSMPDGPDYQNTRTPTLTIRTSSNTWDMDYRAISTHPCMGTRLPIASSRARYNRDAVSTPDPPTATVSASTYCPGDSIRFRYTPLAGYLSEWIFPDGSRRNETDFSVVVDESFAPGNVRLATYGNCGEIGGPSFYVVPAPAPVPTISGPPDAFCVGSVVRFESAIENEAMSHIWQYSDDEGDSWRDLPATISGFTGTRTRQLEITTSRDMDGWLFRARIAGQCETVLSNELTLRVPEVPTGTVEATPNPVCAGDTLILDSDVTGGVSFFWNGPNDFLSRDAVSSRTDVQPEDAGVYTLFASSVCETVELDTLPVVVLAPTELTSGPTPTTVAAGSTTTFTATATADAPEWQWQRFDGGNWQDIPESARVTGTTSPTLRINDSGAADEGLYRAVVNGTCGRVESTGAALSVEAL